MTNINFEKEAKELEMVNPFLTQVINAGKTVFDNKPVIAVVAHDWNAGQLSIGATKDHDPQSLVIILLIAASMMNNALATEKQLDIETSMNLVAEAMKMKQTIVH